MVRMCLAGAAAADVAEFVVLRGVGGGDGDEGLRFAFAEPALGGSGGHGLREGIFLGNVILGLTRWVVWGRMRLLRSGRSFTRSCLHENELTRLSSLCGLCTAPHL